MPNAILTPTAVTREALRVLHQKLTFVGSINRQYDDSFAQSGAKIGTDLKIRLPNEYVVRSGALLNAQDTAELSTTLTVNSQKGVDLNFTSNELTMSLDNFSDRIIEPAMAVLSAAIEADCLTMRQDVYYQVNNAGSAPTLNKLLLARKRLVDSLTPEGKRTALLTTQDNVDLVDQLKALFQDDRQLSMQYRDGVMGHAIGFDFVESTHATTQARGTATTAYVVTTTVSVQGSTTLAVQTGTGTFKKGDVITISSVNEVHPETKVSTARLQQFVVTADYAGGAGNLSVSPAMWTTTGRQNIDAFPQAAATIAIAGTIGVPYGGSVVYHKDAFAFASADLVMPKGVDWGARENYDGISMRIVRQYDITNDKFPCRLDVLYGYKTIRPQLACRFSNN